MNVIFLQPHEPAKYMMDCLLTHFVIIPIAILTWRSAWATVGHFLFPQDAWLSDVVALAIGMPATMILFAFQSPLAKISCKLEERGNGFGKLLYEDFIYLITSLCQFFIWRGGWNLNARYLLADPLVGGWVNHVVGTILLMCLQLFSYVSACGCALDGFDPRGKAIFPLRYLRHYLRHYKKVGYVRSKHLSIFSHVLKARDTNCIDIGLPFNGNTIVFSVIS